jgi:PA14 domain-containing protein/Ig-like domain-containing protein/lectin family protein
MNSTRHPQTNHHPLSSTNLISLRLFLTAAFAALGLLFPAQAGTFSSDFNSGLPDGTAVFGVATNDLVGGYTNSGCIKLTTAVNSVAGVFLLANDLDAGVPVVSFTANFRALVGGGSGADGFSFNFASDLDLTGAWGAPEEGNGTGLTVEFDTYSNASPATDSLGIDVKIGGSEVASQYFAGLRANTFVDVVIQLHPDGTLAVIYDGFDAYTNLDLTAYGWSPVSGGHFGFGARTGDLNDNQFIDDLNITTQTAPAAFVDYFSPVGRKVRADAPLHIVLTDDGTSVATNTIVLQLDGSPVVPAITQSGTNTLIDYAAPSLFASGSTHTVNLVVADNATPTPNTNNLQYDFTVSSYGALATNLAADPAFVDLGSPGFFIRYSQIADSGSREVSRAELQLANLLIDGSTGLPYNNLAAPNPADSSFTYAETNVINYGFPAGSTGDFPADANVPGIPGPTTGDGSSYAMDAVTYLHLSPGFYRLGVNSSDGFQLTIADGADVFAPQEAIFSGVRDAADTTVSFSVALDGYYPFRLVYFTGDPSYAPAPGTAVPSVEFFSLSSSGQGTLINDTNVVGYVPAFRAAKTKPYIRSVNPNIGDSGVPGNTAISATLVDGTLTVQTNTITLNVNGTPVTAAISRTAGVSSVTYQPTGVFLPNSSNYVSLAFSDSESNRSTNTWSFTVANIMTPIWSIAAVNNTWVTAGSTERGLAYNPKTGHLILVSRAAAPAPANGLGIAILDSTSGAVLGTMNIGDIASTGVGTFKLSMVDVADDGVIYVGNLTTSATVPFRIYRWADENSAPLLVYSANPIGGATRCGDDFRVRGSGAGTQIIASGNSAVTTIPVFTTTDGTNFTSTALNISGIAANVLRLGLAWGCGNNFYGETTGKPASYVGFSGLPSTAASLLASYGIYDNNTNQSIGPIGLDIANQRLIGNQTIAPHSINMFDVPSLAQTPAQNFPLDQRNYASQNTSFGTGSVDFSPDGSHVFCLDTGNGIIAFSLAAKPAAPSICAQPQNFIVAGIGGVGFMDVTAIGSPQKYQWRFNEVNLSGATNRTLDIYSVQQNQLGQYRVVITNSMGSVTSSVAYLDTLMAATINPSSQVIPAGGSATFTAVVTNGLPPYAYQWALNGNNIANATSSSLTIMNAQVSDAGGYTVALTDSLSQAITSPVAVLTVGNLGNGSGLVGDYYTTQLQTFSGAPTLTRLDPTVNFDWDIGSPDPSISPDTFTVRWAGLVQPIYSQTYTFYTTSDDGSRLWVNGQLVVDNWFDQPPTERSGTIDLSADQQYPILMEYYENTGGALVQLSWSSAAQFKGIIPQTQLYPTTAPLQPTFANLGGTNLVLSWFGSYALESATDVRGPYSPIAGATSPYTNTIGSEPEMFFRLTSQ